MNMHDAIVIGSGIGGMTAAGLLAGVAGKKVLVLEKHTEPGGLTHVFRRDGASWDVGLHYVGEVEPGSQGRAFFDYLSGGELLWTRMPDRFERFVYPGIDISVPSNPATYERVLSDRFPQEAAAIRRYFKDVKRARRWAILGFMRGMVPRPVEPLLRWTQQLTGRLAKRTTGAVLAARFRSPELRAVLASQWGDYGLPPSQSAFAVHALIVSHYLQGAWYPEGGAARIARTFEKGIERAGGSILVAQEVLEILTDGSKAIGVRVLDRRGPLPVERVYKAPIVISGAGAAITFERLLPTEGEIGTRTAALRGDIQQLSGGLSAVTLYLRLKADPRSIGVQGENHWINTTFEHDDTTAQSRSVLEGSPRSIYVSFPSIKAKDEQFHTAEIIAFVDERAFAQWRDRPKGNRGADYSALKQRIGDGLLRLADAHIPGLAALVSYTELATPLTVEHYTSHPGGRFYGLAASPQRYRSTQLGPSTPIEGLYLAGQDAGCLGIFGAMMGGVGAACQALGTKGFPMIQAAIKSGPVSTPSSSLPPQKKRAVLTAKRALTPSIWHLEFEVTGPVEGYAPGQFARLHVGGGEWRDYSIAGLEGQRVRFLISTRTGGHGSRFVQGASVGTATEVELPLGQYTLERSGRRRVFIATGTGLAPFLPMFESLQAAGTLDEAVLLFGYRTREEDITAEGTVLPGRVIRCVSQDEAPADGYRGRVTAALKNLDFDPETTDFYLCGSSGMVADGRAVLEARGARHLHAESF
jgi:phytoene dehydrogenase-like protein/NAD(P)H-flavin reductase